MSRHQLNKEKVFYELNPFFVPDKVPDQQLLEKSSSPPSLESSYFSNQTEIDFDQNFSGNPSEILDKIINFSIECDEDNSLIESEFNLINDRTIDDIIFEDENLRQSVQENFLKEFAKISIEEKISSTVINRILQKMNDTVCPGKILMINS